MGDVLDEAYSIVRCKECPWYKSCAMPMKLSADDIRRQIETQTPGMVGAGPVDQNMQNFLTSMATAAQNSFMEGCPIFIERLRASPHLAQRIKELMQNWTSEEQKQN